MDRQEFEKWVDYLTQKSRLRLPEVLFKGGYDDVACRVATARWLGLINEYEPAIRLLEDSADEKLPGDTACQAELRATIFNCLGRYYLEYYNDVEKALLYTDKALETAEAVRSAFLAITRGDIWRKRLELLKLAGRIKEALLEIDSKLDWVECCRMVPESWSYYYNACFFKAVLEAKKGNQNQSEILFRKALSFFPA